MKEIRIQKSVELEPYLGLIVGKVAGLVSLIAVLFLFISQRNGALFQANASLLTQMVDLIFLIPTLFIGYGIISILRKLVPVWWRRYVRGVTLLVEHKTGDKEADYDGYTFWVVIGKVDPSWLYSSNPVTRFQLPLYGWFNFRWGKMVKSFGSSIKDSLERPVRFCALSDRSYLSEREAVKLEAKYPCGSRVTNLDFKLATCHLTGMGDELVHLVRYYDELIGFRDLLNQKLDKSNSKNSELMLDCNKLKRDVAEYSNVLAGVAVESLAALEKVIGSSRFVTSAEAGEVGTMIAKIMNSAWSTAFSKDDKQLLEANKAWEKSEVKKKHEQRQNRKRAKKTHSVAITTTP